MKKKFFDLRNAFYLSVIGFFAFYIFDFFKLNELSPVVIFIGYFLIVFGAIKFIKFYNGKK